MGTPEIRNREHFKNADAIRDYLRDPQRMPHWGDGSGLVLTDLDLVHRCYGTKFGTDSTGRVFLIEMKFGWNGMTDGQWSTFRLMDQLMSAGDTDGTRYGGCWLINYELEDDDTPYFTLAERMFLSGWRDRCRIEGHDAVMDFLRTGVGPALTPEHCPW